MSQPSLPASLADVAAALRRRRERRGASIEEAATATRIRPEYLRALEAAAPMDVYPGETYARFFVREYARFLGVEPEGAVGAFIAAQTAVSAAAVASSSSSEAPPPGRLLRSRRPPRAVLVAMVALAVAVPALAVAIRAGAPWGHDAGSAVGSPQPGSSDGRLGASGGVSGGEGATPTEAASPPPGPSTVPTGRPLPVGEAPDPGTSTPAPISELPGGGRIIFPDHRVVAYYGAPGSTTLGVLGDGTPDEVAARLLRQVRAYGGGNRLPVLPAFELIASLATSSAGQAGLYRHHQPDATIAEYLAAIRKVGGLLILDVQPGRADWLSEAKAYERWLKEPDVELALDPEWKLAAGEFPLQQIGTIDGVAVNRVARWLDGIVARYQLPQKLLIVHQFTRSMVTGKARVKLRAGLAITFDVDGFGSAAAKREKWRDLARGDTRFFHGLKLFYVHDPDLLSPQAVLGMGPRPDLIVYQ